MNKVHIQGIVVHTASICRGTGRRLTVEVPTLEGRAEFRVLTFADEVRVGAVRTGDEVEIKGSLCARRSAASRGVRFIYIRADGFLLLRSPSAPRGVGRFSGEVLRVKELLGLDVPVERS